MYKSMRSIMWIPIMISFWVAVIIAKKTCSLDNDCPNQFCITPPGECVDYTICNDYNRVEAAKPSREVSQCGGCLEGYWETSSIESTKKADSCMKKVNSTAGAKKKNETNTTSPYVIMICIIGGFLMFCLYAVHATARCKWNTSSGDSPAAVGETFATSEGQDGISAANVPLAHPYKSQKISNGKCDEVEETDIFPSIQEHSTIFTVKKSHPGHARPFHPPFNVRIDPSYNPEDDRLNPSDIVNEPTTPSQ